MLKISAKRVYTMCGVPKRTFYRWLNYGVIATVTPCAPGAKYPRFSRRQLVFVRLAAAMRKARFGLDDIKDALNVLDAGWNGEAPAQLLADPLGWTFGEQFLIRLNGNVEPLVAVPPVLYDVGKILQQVVLDLGELEAANQEA